MKKILVVEDDESQRILYRDELVECGYEVILAANGKEAVEYLIEGKPDLIILDIIMPEMDGIETLGRIISNFHDIPIILNTAYPAYQQEFVSWSADAYVLKSSDLGELKWWVQELLDEPGTIPYTVGEPTLNRQTHSGEKKFMG